MMDGRIAGRREFRRPIEFELSAIEAADTGAFMSVGLGLDINSHGIGMLADCPLVKGMIIRLSLPLNGCGTTLPVFAEVAWAVPEMDCFRAGLRFLQ